MGPPSQKKTIYYLGTGAIYMRIALTLTNPIEVVYQEPTTFYTDTTVPKLGAYI